MKLWEIVVWTYLAVLLLHITISFFSAEADSFYDTEKRASKDTQEGPAEASHDLSGDRDGVVAEEAGEERDGDGPGR